MPLRGCDVPGCSKPVPRRHGGCLICSKSFCPAHTRSPSHTCPSKESNPDLYHQRHAAIQQQHLRTLLHNINTAALLSLASGLRNGLSCTVPALDQGPAAAAAIPATAELSDTECHLDLVFQDGVVWDLRVLINNGALLPPPVQRYIFLSEVFTLKFLERTAVPAPRVYHHAWQDWPENTVGVSFALMEKIKGRRLHWETLSKPARSKIMEQLADIAIELEQYPFDMTGSIMPSDDPDVIVGGFAQVPLLRDALRPIGPFSSLHASLRAIMYLQLDIITDGEFMSLAVPHFLSYLWRLQTIPDLIAATNSKEGGPFYLQHASETANHIMVDDDGNITALVDWACASVQSKEYAFSSPPMLWPREVFLRGDNTLSAEELEYAEAFRHRGRADMADLVIHGRKLQRFLFALGGSWTNDQAEFEALFQGLRQAFVAEGDEAAAAAAAEPYASWSERAIAQDSVEYPQLHRLFSD
ncbi:hypothetical protein AJ80_09953 [Polytolypa hystricis UAMH7299]|uniref:Aminoglycoside phosphotransferase domain-containing protein n=1 Tax=Polytolypa hystricis (strain UAMH7299) TaxID=1447883 RepID=A0A2B7WGA5_POLH7|nr:hypothetical protein AJ80_09953 [Polytolypa hystricis UAMH7299]